MQQLEKELLHTCKKGECMKFNLKILIVSFVISCMPFQSHGMFMQQWPPTVSMIISRLIKSRPDFRHRINHFTETDDPAYQDNRGDTVAHCLMREKQSEFRAYSCIIWWLYHVSLQFSFKHGHKIPEHDALAKAEHSEKVYWDHFRSLDDESKKDVAKLLVIKNNEGNSPMDIAAYNKREYYENYDNCGYGNFIKQLQEIFQLDPLPEQKEEKM